MKKLFTWLLLSFALPCWAGSFSTGAIDTVARANAATAQATANACVPTSSLSNLNITGGTLTGITGNTSLNSGNFVISGTGLVTAYTGYNASGPSASYKLSSVTFLDSTGIQGTNIGSTTPGTGAFTTLSASSTVSGAGFSTYLASPPTIGATAPNPGTFTNTNATLGFKLNGVLLFSATAPTIASGFGTSPSIAYSNGTASIKLQIGTGGTASTGTITMPASTHDWSCGAHADPNYETPQAGSVMYVGTTNSTTITVNNYTQSTSAALAWPAGYVVNIDCVSR